MQRFPREFERRFKRQLKRPTWNSTQQDVLAARQQVAAVESKLLLYKTILKPHGIQFWTISKSNVEIIQRFQNKYLRIIVNAPWYVTNDTLHHDLNVPAIDLMSDAETLRGLKRILSQDLCI